jgi:hypothetical protein
MKTKEFVLTFFVLATCFSCGDVPETDSTKYLESIKDKLTSMNFERPKDSYNYPIYPGTKKWLELSPEEMIEVCQIPGNVLETMSTQAIIQSIWEYPLLHEVFNRAQYQMDFKALFSENNSYNELCKRPDAGIALLHRLDVVNPAVYETRFEFGILELLMAQDVFLSQLNMNYKIVVVENILESSSLQEQNVDFTNNNEKAIAWLLLGRVMMNADYTPFVTAINEDDELFNYLTLNSYVYVKEIYGNIPQTIIEHAMRFTQTEI